MTKFIDYKNAENFTGAAVTDINDPAQRTELIKNLRVMNICVLSKIISRFERNLSENYPFIDTKLNIITAKNFDRADNLCGRDRIFSWIQSRGIEALTGHYYWLQNALWLDETSRNELTNRLNQMILKIIEGFQFLRGQNSGRLGFVMSADGKILTLDNSGQISHCVIEENSPASFSDIFGCKALIKAARYTNDKKLELEAVYWFDKVNKDIKSGSFESDQLSLDPSNPATKPVAGRFTHGPRMIFIGAAATFFEVTQDRRFFEIGLEHIEYIIKNFTNSDGRIKNLQQFDMFEFIDTEGNPFIEDGNIIRCDGGHSCEFVGLGLKLLLQLGEKHSKHTVLINTLKNILLKNFQNSFSANAVGMYKGVDLVTGEALGTNMPWWALPETFRAAIEAKTLDHCETAATDEIASKSISSFFQYFVNPRCNLMAFQTVNDKGAAVNAIPATPDADPGYHTGLSIIDAIEMLEEVKKA